MHDLTFVGMSSDGASMVFKDATGTEFLVPADERMSLALKIDRENPPVLIEELSVREIQTRIRAGASVEDIAADTGMAVEKVERYSGPPLAEREFMVERAQSVMFRREDGSASLEDTVQHTLLSRGVDLDSLTWDAWKREDNLWCVVARYNGSSGPVIATWTYDNAGRTIVPVDPEGAILMGAVTDTAPTIITERPVLAPVPDLIEDALPAEIIVLEEEIVEEVIVLEETEIIVVPEAALTDEPEELELALEPAPEPAAKPKPRGKKGRTSVPSWDEILFGAPE